MIREVLALEERLTADPTEVRDLLVMADLVITDEIVAEQSVELLKNIAEIEKHYKKAQQFRQKLQAVSRSMKPKMHRNLRWSLARTMVNVSRLVRCIPFTSSTRRQLAVHLRQAVEELRPIEQEIAKIQRKLEAASSANGNAAVTKGLSVVART